VTEDARLPRLTRPHLSWLPRLIKARSSTSRFARDSLLEGAGFEPSVPPPPGARRQIPALQAKTPFAVSLHTAGEEGEWVSGPDYGLVGNRKTRRRAQGLVNDAETLAHLDETLHRRGIGNLVEPVMALST
jgi:hypothetical protein